MSGPEDVDVGPFDEYRRLKANSSERSRSGHSDNRSARGAWKDADDEREAFKNQIRRRMLPDTPSSHRSRSPVPSPTPSAPSTLPYDDQLPRGGSQRTVPSTASGQSTIGYPEPTSETGATAGSSGSTTSREFSVHKANERG